jgi:hypothetical protein
VGLLLQTGTKNGLQVSHRTGHCCLATHAVRRSFRSCDCHVFVTSSAAAAALLGGCGNYALTVATQVGGCGSAFATAAVVAG